MGYDVIMGRAIPLAFILFAAPLLLSAQNTASSTSLASSVSSSTVALKSNLPALPTLKPARTLRKGMQGSDVQTLQKYLQRMPDIYPDGSVTGYFGSATELAIKLLQAREGLVDPKSAGAEYGAVGPKTLAKINAIINKSASQGGMATTSLQMPPQAATSTKPATSTPAASKAALPARDTTPPLRSRGSPSNTLPAGAPEITVSLMTNEPARCYWSNTPRTPFGEMATSFSTTGGTFHSFVIKNVTVGDYSFFVKCRDTYVNTNTSDYPILFSIERRYSGRDYDLPRVFISAPTDGDAVVEGQVALSAAAADNTGVAGVSFFLNGYDLKAEDVTPPFGVAVMLEPGAYRAFAVARDADGNRATSTPVAFSVVAKTSAAAQPPGLNLAAAAVHALSAVQEFFAKLLPPW